MANTNNEKETIHPSVSFERVEQAIQDDACMGFYIACGDEAYQVEPDVCNYTCESCGMNKVFGAEEILMQFGRQLK